MKSAGVTKLGDVMYSACMTEEHFTISVTLRFRNGEEAEEILHSLELCESGGFCDIGSRMDEIGKNIYYVETVESKT